MAELSALGMAMLELPALQAGIHSAFSVGRICWQGPVGLQPLLAAHQGTAAVDICCTPPSLFVGWYKLDVSAACRQNCHPPDAVEARF